MECPYFVEPNLAGSCMPGRADLGKITSLGIKHVVALAEDWEFKFYGGWEGVHEYKEELEDRGVKLLHWPTPDGHPPQDLLALVRIIESLLRAGPVMVHCVGGIGRTPTTLAAYLIYKGADVHEALRRVSEAVPSISISEEQYNALLELEAELRG
ncbi:protein-tyrosine phosphatase family protein [Thermoproteus tenax]|uniref:protein-tyrosine phosphatase family protein n=1 Tax=Thermoproteus tenax TaxID=2271 RepID=UPI001E638320|nr:dual specificity protein phosphatase family protein [Thermoproteus tenax]